MSISKQSNGYSLELLVGIQDEFSGKSKAIEAETKRLDKEVKELQKTTGDITKFKKSEEALEDLEKQQLKNKDAITKQREALKKLKKESGDTKDIERHERALQKLEKQDRETTASAREHERQLRRLRRSLTDTGVDLNNLSNDEARLQAKIEKTNKAIKEQTQSVSKLGDARANMQSFADKMTIAAGFAGAGAYLMFRGDNMEKHAREYSARTGTDYESLMTPEQQKFRADLVRGGATSGEIFTAMGMAKHQGLSDDETMALSAATVQLGQVFPNFDPQELSRAIANTAKAFDVSVDKAASRIASTMQISGDANNDLLDTFAEYAPLLGDDISLDQYAAGLAAARKAGVWNYDKIGDSLKETFRARFSDRDEFAKLVGGGNQSGAIDAIGDVDLRKEVRTRAMALRHSINIGEGADEAYAAFMQSLIPVYAQDKGAVKPILEAAGGTILSEDVGIKGIEAFTDAITNPETFIRNINVAELAQSTRTTLERGADSGRAVQSVIDTSAAQLIHSQDYLTSAIQDLTGTLTDSMIDSPSLGYGALAAEWAALGIGVPAAIKWLSKKAGGRGLASAGGAATEAALGGGASSTASRAILSKAGLARLGTLGYAATLTPEFSPIAWGRAEERDDRASIFGFKTSEAGRLGIDQNLLEGYKKVGLLDVWDEWFGSDKTNTAPEEVQQVERMVIETASQNPLVPQAAPATIQIEYQPQITIDLIGATPEQAQALSSTLVDALRNMTPELEQQLRDAMSDIMQASDYLEH
ncbi:phage tail tape measure protein [Vibrio campbellii]|uniref:phage tail tape measure protein n=1 Tax=Vibrio campbellii TaxID=680 RepID=UPI001F3079BA|nr:phage tail tape measure protein [Vibrio campbellii]MCE7729608.1 phage tail tape measure protein [Vibrio campbellii]